MVVVVVVVVEEEEEVKGEEWRGRRWRWWRMSRSRSRRTHGPRVTVLELQERVLRIAPYDRHRCILQGFRIRIEV